VKHHGVDVDIEDKDGEMPIVHALSLSEEEAWKTISLLFYPGARKDREAGEGFWSYADLARSMRKHNLADKLAAAGDDCSGSCTLNIE
jgi:hypothetical protein